MDADMKKLGFGLMRLPMNGESFDIPQLCDMVDLFLEKGFSYFDTAYAYPGSEDAMRKALVERHPRGRYTIANKMPTFMLRSEGQLKQLFEESLSRSGVDYFDYYLMHDLSRNSYPACEQVKGFDFLRKMKQEGKIRNMGFSFHDHAELLDEILTANPDVDFVQLQINYLDWESPVVQSRACYETAVKHGKKVVVMEPVKGGTLANMKPEIAARFTDTENSKASWAIRFAASLENVMVVLSGMSNMEQMRDNVGYMADFIPLTDKDREFLFSVADDIRKSTPIACTSCRYCVPGCPQKIAIPDYFALYNAEQNDYNKGMGAHMDYFSTLLANNGKPSDCIGCRQCEKICPQHLTITEYLGTIKTEMEIPAMEMAAMMAGE